MKFEDTSFRAITIPSAAKLDAAGDFSFLQRQQRRYHKFLAPLVCHIGATGFRVYCSRSSWERDYLAKVNQPASWEK